MGRSLYARIVSNGEDATTYRSFTKSVEGGLCKRNGALIVTNGEDATTYRSFTESVKRGFCKKMELSFCSDCY